jgi:glutamine---fructose-6-phosphate transaminase (isomerizing)
MHEFAHAMLTEIYEQPEALRRTIALYCGSAGLQHDFERALDRWRNSKGEVLIAASGSSRHAGLAAEIILEDLCHLAVDVEYASEFSCRGINSLREPSVLLISQSGETSDTLAALRVAKSQGLKTLAIVNAPNSTMASEATLSMPLAAGVEKAIPATKSFTCQLAVLTLLALYEAHHRKQMDDKRLYENLAELQRVPALIESALPAWTLQMESLAQKYSSASTFLYLGRGVHYAIAREGALKLKECSYLHAEGYPSGELKHGPNALVSERVPLVVLVTRDDSLAASQQRYEKTIRLIEDLKAQGAQLWAIGIEGDPRLRELCDDLIEVPSASEYLLPILEVIPLQLFSYFMALQRGIDVDRPRNLSKAVIDSVQ